MPLLENNGRKQGRKNRNKKGKCGKDRGKEERKAVTSLPQHSFQGWDCVPLGDASSLVLSFPDPHLCKTVLLLLALPLSPSTVCSLSTRSDPLSERREFWREGVLGCREIWPFFSSEGQKGKSVNQTHQWLTCDVCVCVCVSLTSQCLHRRLIMSTQELSLNGLYHSLESATRTWEARRRTEC